MKLQKTLYICKTTGPFTELESMEIPPEQCCNYQQPTGRCGDKGGKCDARKALLVWAEHDKEI